MNDIRPLLRKHDAAISAICDILYDHNVSGADGEQILLWLAGCSAGTRQISIRGDWLYPVAHAWKLAASQEPQAAPRPRKEI